MTLPFTTCWCDPQEPCLGCPFAHPCSCGAGVGQRCRRPSGHTGPFVGPHEHRLLRSDADAIAENPDKVRARLLAQREDGGQAIASWLRALRGLQAEPGIWHGRFAASTLAELVELAKHGDIAGVQMTFGLGER